jgi:hypothetical protein
MHPFLSQPKFDLQVLSQGLKLPEILKYWQGYPNFEKDVWKGTIHQHRDANSRGVAQRLAIENQKSNDMNESEPLL